MKGPQMLEQCARCNGHGLTYGYNCQLCRGSGQVARPASTAHLLEALRGSIPFYELVVPNTETPAVFTSALPGRYIVFRVDESSFPPEEPE